MISDSIELNQSKSQLYQLSQSNLTNIFDENELNKSRTFMKEAQEKAQEKAKEIPGLDIPNDIEEIKVNQIQENINDKPAENFLKLTSEYDKTYRIEVPKKPGTQIPEEKIKLGKKEKKEIYIIMKYLKKKCENMLKLDEKNGIKKTKFNSLKDFHEVAMNKFSKNEKYKNNPEQANKDANDFIKSIDIIPLGYQLINYWINYLEINGEIEELEKEDESFENSIDEDPKSLAVKQNINNFFNYLKNKGELKEFEKKDESFENSIDEEPKKPENLNEEQLYI